MAAKFSILVMKMLTGCFISLYFVEGLKGIWEGDRAIPFTQLSIDEPAASRTAARFLRTCS